MDAFLARISTHQLREWLAYFYLEDEDAKDRQLEAESQARASTFARRR